MRHLGLPARACCLTPQQANRAHATINDLVGRGEVKAPVVIIRESTAPPASEARAARDLQAAAALGHRAAWLAIQKAGAISRVWLADGSLDAAARVAAFTSA